MDKYITLISLAMGVSSFIGGLILWYRGAVEKRYAAERDFQHLRRNYEQVCEYLENLEEKLDHKSESLMQQFLELKGMLYGILGDRTAGGSIRASKRD